MIVPESWGADVSISMPIPPSADRPAIINLGPGWAMTTGGIAPDLDEATWEEIVTPHFAPPMMPELTRFSDA